VGALRDEDLDLLLAAACPMDVTVGTIAVGTAVGSGAVGVTGGPVAEPSGSAGGTHASTREAVCELLRTLISSASPWPLGPRQLARLGRGLGERQAGEGGLGQGGVLLAAALVDRTFEAQARAQARAEETEQAEAEAQTPAGALGSTGTVPEAVQSVSSGGLVSAEDEDVSEQDSGVAVLWRAASTSASASASASTAGLGVSSSRSALDQLLSCVSAHGASAIGLPAGHRLFSDASEALRTGHALGPALRVRA
jgi:hypothetical protein